MCAVATLVLTYRMRSSLTQLAFAVTVVVALPASGAAAADALRVGGTGTATGFLQQVGAEFAATGGMRIVVVPSLGSSGAIRALADGKIDVAVSARPLKSEETAAGLRQAAVFRTAYVIATSHRNPGGLKSTDIAAIYASANPTWPDGSPVRIILRPRTDTDTELLGALFAGMREAMETARRRPEMPTAATDQDSADMAERLSGSLSGSTATQIKTEGRHLQAIPIDGIAPTFENFESGAYRFAKKLYFIEKQGGDPGAGRFIAFLRSPAGLKALREVEVLPEAN